VPARFDPRRAQGEDGYYKIPKGPEPPGLPRHAKLTEKEGREIARLAHAGANRIRLAKRHGVKPNHVHRLMRKYPAVKPQEAARVLAKHSGTAEEDVIEGGRTPVRRVVREANREGAPLPVAFRRRRTSCATWTPPPTPSSSRARPGRL
jgi:hypothetical protein